MPTVQPGTRLLDRIDAMGVRHTADHWTALPPALAARLRVRLGRAGGALMTCAATSTSLRLNRVIGLRAGRAGARARVDQVLTFYRDAGARRFGVLHTPGVGADALARTLAARGLEPQGGLVLLARPCRLPLPAAPRDVPVRRATRAEAARIHRLHERVFGAAPTRAEWALASLRRGPTAHYLAWAGGIPVGAGSLRIDARLAWIGGGGVLPGHRRRGVHRALILARLRQAERAGCQHVWVETGLPRPRRPAGSFRNLLRLGFAPLAIRPWYVWTRPRSGG